MRALGAGLDDEALGEFVDTPDSSFMMVREQVQVAVCVAESEVDPDGISLWPIGTVARLAALDGGWRDPTFASTAPDYPDQSEDELNIVAGFVMSARAAVAL